jgi:hypothetical protein
MAKKSTVKNEIMSYTYVGQFVEALAEIYVGGEVFPLRIDMYLVLIDDDFYHFGTDPEFICKSVVKSAIKYVGLITDDDYLSIKMQEAVPPENEEDYN